MAVIWDSVLVAAAARALRERLLGARLRAVHLDRGDLTLVLWFREATLAARLHPGAGALTLHEPADPPPEARPLQANLRAVEAPPDDRVLRFGFLKVRGSTPVVDVFVELMTNQWNGVVTDGPERTVRHVLRERGGERPLRPGSPYASPPPSEREGRDGGLSFDRWREILLPAAPGRRRGLLLRRVAWTSSLTAPALLGAAAGDGKGSDVDGALQEGHALWTRLARVGADAPLEGPAALLDPDGDAPQPYPFPLPGRAARPAPDVLEAMEAAAAAQGDAGGAAVLPSSLLEALESLVDEARGRVARLEAELAEAPDPASLRALGDLLLARFGDVPRGAAEARLAGFDGERVLVPLDPTRAVHENAERFYQRAARSERARQRLPALIHEARRGADEAARRLEEARSGDLDAAAVRAALPLRSRRSDGESAETLPYRRYRSSGGLEIRVGRGSKRNDDLTFHHSSPEDVWLHARHAAGAHVILRWSGEGNPPARDLAEAATLAALHSRARTSGSVPVDWTRRKHVRKPRKAPPGSVLPDRVSTVFVEPDADLEARLRAD